MGVFSLEREADEPRSIEVISDIIHEYEVRPDRPAGHVVTRFVAEMEPHILAEIARQTGLSEEELHLYIENDEIKARRIDVVHVSTGSKLAMTEEQKKRSAADPDDYEYRQREFYSDRSSHRA